MLWTEIKWVCAEFRVVCVCVFFVVGFLVISCFVVLGGMCMDLGVGT